MQNLLFHRTKSKIYPILKEGACAKLNPAPVGPVWGGMAGLAGAAGDAAAPAPKVKTPEVLLVAPNPLALNWKPPPKECKTHFFLNSRIISSRGTPVMINRAPDENVFNCDSTYLTLN